MKRRGRGRNMVWSETGGSLRRTWSGERPMEGLKESTGEEDRRWRGGGDLFEDSGVTGLCGPFYFECVFLRAEGGCGTFAHSK